MKKKTLFLTCAGALSAIGLGLAITFKPVCAPQIALAEEEVVTETTTTEITPEQEKTITDIIKETVNEVLNSWDLKAIFTPQNIMSFISLIFTSGIGVALVKVYGKYKSEVTITRKAIFDAVEKMLPQVSEQVLGEIVDKVLAPLSASVGSIEEAIGVFSRCLALAQENTPESRLAILRELESVKIKDESVIAKVEETIKKAIADAQKAIDDKIKLLEDMEKLQKESEEVKPSVGEIKEETPVDDGTSI